jgi:hypothetical protein
MKTIQVDERKFVTRVLKGPAAGDVADDCVKLK